MTALLNEISAKISRNCYIEPALYENYSGFHFRFGDNVYLDFNLMIVDDTHIYGDDNVIMGSIVVISSGILLIAPSVHEKGLQYHLSIHIGNNV